MIASFDRARVIKAATLLTALFTSLFLPAMWITGDLRSENAIWVGATAVTFVIATVLAWGLDRPVGAAHLLLVGLTVSIGTVAFARGGVQVHLGVAFSMIPLLSGFLLDRKAVFIYTMGLIVLLVPLLTVDALGLIPPNPMTHRGQVLFGGMTIALGVILTASITVLWKTETDRFAQKLADARDRAVAADQAKSAFLANMSHDIRTPLNGVLGMTELLLNSELDTLQRRQASTIRRSGDLLLRLLNDILDFSKIEAGLVELTKSSFEIVEAIEDTVAIYAEPAHSKGLELVVRIDDGVPATVIGDSARLAQMIGNLVSNAVKFTEHGEVVVVVSAPKPCWVQISVSDTGCGISPEGLRKAFDRFTQVGERGWRGADGSGLGLSITSQLADILGGSVSATSELGSGSCFTLILPMQIGEQIPARFESLSPLTVLVVDDNATNRDALERVLRRWGMTVLSFERPEDALRDVIDRPDLAVLDFHMPSMNGAVLARKLRDRFGETACVVMSSAGAASKEQAGRNVGDEVYLSKPVRQSALRRAIQQVSSPRAKPMPQRTPKPTRMSSRLLLVEDNEINRMVLVGLLGAMGFEAVEIARDGVEAVEAVRRGTFDLILMDVQMPRMDGREATRRIRKMHKHLPIFGLTASALLDEQRANLEAGMDEVLTKPIRSGDLSRAIHDHLKSSK